MGGGGGDGGDEYGGYGDEDGFDDVLYGDEEGFGELDMYGVDLDDDDMNMVPGGANGVLAQEDEQLVASVLDLADVQSTIKHTIKSVGQNTIQMIVSAHDEEHVPASKRFTERQKQVLSDEIFN